MEIARHWRLNNQRYRLQGSICTHCNKPSFQPRMVCDTCPDQSKLNTSKGDIYTAPIEEKTLSQQSSEDSQGL